MSVFAWTRRSEPLRLALSNYLGQKGCKDPLYQHTGVTLPSVELRLITTQTKWNLEKCGDLQIPEKSNMIFVSPNIFCSLICFLVTWTLAPCAKIQVPFLLPRLGRSAHCKRARMPCNIFLEPNTNDTSQVVTCIPAYRLLYSEWPDCWLSIHSNVNTGLDGYWL